MLIAKKFYNIGHRSTKFTEPMAVAQTEAKDLWAKGQSSRELGAHNFRRGAISWTVTTVAHNKSSLCKIS